MAGQKNYNTLISTTGKSPIIATAAMTVDASKASNGTAVVFGKSFGYSNANGVVTVTLPEKYGRVEYIHVSVVDTGKTGVQAVISTDYSYPAGTFTFSLISATQTAITTGIYKCYIMFYVVQSM